MRKLLTCISVMTPKRSFSLIMGVVLTITSNYPATSRAATVAAHQDFVANLNNNLFALSPDPLDFNLTLGTGNAQTQSTQPDAEAAVGIVFGIVGAVIAICALSDSCKSDVDRAYSNARRFFTGDPQEAFLLSSIHADGRDVTNQLLTEALLPENILFKANLPTFLGGATYTASSAFSGTVFDENGDPLQDGGIVPGLGIVTVGFGVFETTSGDRFFTPTIFADTFQGLLRLKRLSLTYHLYQSTTL